MHHKRPFRLSLLGLGLIMLGGTSSCGVGTDPSLLDKGDAALRLGDAQVSPDAAASLPHAKPPIDEITYNNVEVATFALG